MPKLGRLHKPIRLPMKMKRHPQDSDGQRHRERRIANITTCNQAITKDRLLLIYCVTPQTMLAKERSYISRRIALAMQDMKATFMGTCSDFTITTKLRRMCRGLCGWPERRGLLLMITRKRHVDVVENGIPHGGNK